jgi:uncharacterized damage-inducible protein DinB
MPSVGSKEHQALLAELQRSRGYIFEAIQGLDESALRRQILPSGWTCLGLINHLSVDVERFWFQAVAAGDESAIAETLESDSNAWSVGDDEPVEDVVEGYRRNAEHADDIIGVSSLDASPAWWPEFFGAWRLETVREIVLHVIRETATHGGQLDAARELIDGKLHRVLTES